MGLGPDRDDDFGIFLAQVHGHADENGKPIDNRTGTGNAYRDQSKRLIENQRKKKAAKK